MYCDFCLKFGTDKTTFIKGCESLGLESIKKHEASNTHVLAAKKHYHEANPEDALASKAKCSLNKTLFPKFQHLFKTVHAINIKGRPHRDYLWQCELDKSRGLDIGNHYQSMNACLESTTAIADVQRAEIKDYLAKCDYIAVIVNGSTDSSITDNEILYVQMCQKDVHKQTLYNVAKYKEAQQQVLLMQWIEQWQIMNLPDFVKKLVALESDGAEGMLGKNAGVIALLKKNNHQ